MAAISVLEDTFSWKCEFQKRPIYLNYAPHIIRYAALSAIAICVFVNVLKGKLDDAYIILNYSMCRSEMEGYEKLYWYWNEWEWELRSVWL